jgi:hypothetical protein
VRDRCPKCKSCLQGEEIPEAGRKHYEPGVTHFSLLLSVYDRRQDCTVAWRCPYCQETNPSRSYFQVEGSK